MPTKLAIDDCLIAEAQKLGRHRTKKEAVYRSPGEYIQRRKHLDVIGLFGKIDFDENYDHKRERTSKQG